MHGHNIRHRPYNSAAGVRLDRWHHLRHVVANVHLQYQREPTHTLSVVAEAKALMGWLSLIIALFATISWFLWLSHRFGRDHDA